MIHKSEDASQTNTHTLGGALHRALHEMRVELGGEDTLKTNPGKSFTVLQMGMDSLHRRLRTMEIPEASWDGIERKTYDEYAKGETLCESPIERSMLAALLTGEWSGFGTIPPRVHNGLNKEEMKPEGDVIIVPQMAFMRYRLDFGVVLSTPGRINQIVAVECDGADFHTDYRRELLRVQYLKSWGIPVFKFKGSELHNDALGCAKKAILSICQWRDQQ